MTAASDKKSILMAMARKQLQEGLYTQARDTCLELLELQQDHLDALKLLGLAALHRGTANTAEIYLRQALRLLPDDADLHCNLGIALAMQCELDQAVDEFQRAVDLQPNSGFARTQLEQAAKEQQRITDKLQLADDANMVPTITFSDEERKSRQLRRQKANDATSLFRNFGYLVIEDLFEKSYIEGIFAYFRNEYPQFFQNDKGSKGVEVSDKRSLIKTPIDGAFKDPAFYMPELLYPILTQLLGDRFIMLTLGTVVSRPGAQEQRIHSDHSPLFDSEVLDRQVPPFAITVATPLVDMNDITGTTRMYDKTHLRVGFPDETEKQHYIEPEISVGSVLLFDYRLQHCGTANRSNNVRPLVCGVYGRPWFRDAANYFRQEALLIPDEVYAQIPPRYLKLFEWTRHGMQADNAS